MSDRPSYAKPVDIGLFFELTYNLFVTANYRASNTRAQNVNTIDEVPDSGWFTNRVGGVSMTEAEVAKVCAGNWLRVFSEVRV